MPKKQGAYEFGETVKGQCQDCGKPGEVIYCGISDAGLERWLCQLCMDKRSAEKAKSRLANAHAAKSDVAGGAQREVLELPEVRELAETAVAIVADLERALGQVPASQIVDDATAKAAVRFVNAANDLDELL